MASESITELASIIAINTAKIESYYALYNPPRPSFDVNAPSKSLIPSEEVEIEKARQALLDATLNLHNLVLGPRDYIQSFLPNELLSLHAIAHYKLANAVPFDKEVSYSQIAATTGLNEADAKRVLRHAMAKHFSHEPRKGFVVHTAPSKHLAEDAQLADWVGVSTELWETAAHTINAMEKFPGSQEPHETGFALANNTKLSAYEYLGQHPERAQRFGNSMASFTKDPEYDLKHLVDNYPWEFLGNRKVVDVGGSKGFVCVALANAFPPPTFGLPSIV